MKKFFGLAAALLLGLLFSPGQTLHAQVRSLTGAGGTFPYPLYSKMFDAYYHEYGVKVNYQAIGSGGGIRQLKNRTVDFGASDAFLSDKQLEEMGSPVVHVATCMGAVTLSYNLPGNPKLKLTPAVLADIFLGKITKWTDPRIRAINPGVKLPDMNMFVAHRSDASGTTFIFTNYLSKISPEWKEKVGNSIFVNWPVGLGGKGNAGVAALIREIPGSIGYVELIYALQNHMPYALLRNKSGRFINPTLASTSAAANVRLPADMRVSVTDTAAANGYPICGFTYILLYKEMSTNIQSRARAEQVAKLVWWMVHQGQKYTLPLYYSPLPSKARKNDENTLKSLTFNGERLLK